MHCNNGIPYSCCLSLSAWAAQADVNAVLRRGIMLPQLYKACKTCECLWRMSWVKNHSLLLISCHAHVSHASVTLQSNQVSIHERHDAHPALAPLSALKLVHQHIVCAYSAGLAMTLAV